MKVLVACEYSGAVRNAFTAEGHDATSCDLLPNETPGKHYQGDVFDIIENGWDMLIAFPPCTHLCISGARWHKEKKQNGQQQQAIEFFKKLAEADINRIAIENPIGIMSTTWMPPAQIIQPWMFGHPETKATCL
jgi:site-specific DNA-cytosine methylase